MRAFKRKPEDKKSSDRIFVRLTKADHAEIKKRAELRNVTITKYVLRTALGRPIRTNNVHKIINELRVVSNQQRELYKTDRRNEQKYQEILQAVVDTILSIPLNITSKHADDEETCHFP